MSHNEQKSDDRDAQQQKQRQLLLEIAGGSDRALETIYDHFERPLYSLGLRWIGDPKLAEEMVQEVTVRIWRGAGTFDPQRGEASSWIFGIARNVATDLARARQRAPQPVGDVPYLQQEALDEDAAWESWQVAECLAALPSERRKVIELAFIQHQTHSEVAETLGVPLGTVKTRMYAGLKELKGLLTDRGIVAKESR